MSWLQLIILSIVQGITEFLPISSSGHLILVGEYFASHGGKDQGLMIDVGTHLGTLAAVMVYFRARVAQIFRGLRDILLRRKSFDGYLVWCLVVGTIPGLIGGALIMLVDESLMRHVPIIIATSIIFGALLWIADKKGADKKNIDQHLTIRHALIVGLAQMVALIPGTSRSGITMTAARFLGYARVDAARLSFLLSIPVTAAAVGVYLLKIALNPPAITDVQDFFIVAVMTFFVALGAIHFLLKWLVTHNFTVFVLYRFALAVLLIWWIAY
jgi:undecaprenyl-diphosphatase